EDDLPSPHMDSDGDARGDDARVRVHERIFEVELDLARLGDAPLERLLEEEIADLEAAELVEGFDVVLEIVGEPKARAVSVPGQRLQVLWGKLGLWGMPAP